MKILGYEYTVTIDDHDVVNGSGYQYTPTQKIRVSNRDCQEQRESTLLHEIIEAINCHLELKLEHPQIMGLEVGLYGALKSAGVDLTGMLERVTKKGAP